MHTPLASETVPRATLNPEPFIIHLPYFVVKSKKDAIIILSAFKSSSSRPKVEGQKQSLWLVRQIEQDFSSFPFSNLFRKFWAKRHFVLGFS